MISSPFASAMAVATLLSMASAASSTSSIDLIPTPTAHPPLNAMTDQGCFDTGYPLEDHGPWTFQTAGNCQPICVLLQKPVMGLVDGTNCWCGDLLPPAKSQVDNSTCNTPCQGFDTAFCGGNKKWWISLTGLTKNHIDNADPPVSSSSSSSHSNTPAAQTSQAQSTAIVTITDSPTAKPPPSSGPNKAGIAAGVVVGVVVLVAIIVGVVLFLRHKRRRDVEEDYRRQAAVNSFVSGGKLHTSSSSMTDSRLDPEFHARRQSNGSIADNEDYSRRILKVTNA